MGTISLSTNHDLKSTLVVSPDDTNHRNANAIKKVIPLKASRFLSDSEARCRLTDLKHLQSRGSSNNEQFVVEKDLRALRHDLKCTSIPPLSPDLMCNTSRKMEMNRSAIVSSHSNTAQGGDTVSSMNNDEYVI